MRPIAVRLLSQQLISPQFSSPKEVVAHLGAVQAQDYRMMWWAVMMRMKKPAASWYLAAGICRGLWLDAPTLCREI